MNPIRSVCVFCGSAVGNDPGPKTAAARLGTMLARAGVELVFGGGRAGLMGALADAALAAGGEVVGVIPRHLVERERGHPDVARLEMVDSMHARKQRMFELADGFAVLPGGVGTLDETFEIITWKQLGMHDKPIVIVNDGGYWSGLDALIGHMERNGFIGRDVRGLYRVVDTVDEVLDALAVQPSVAMETDPSRL